VHGGFETSSTLASTIDIIHLFIFVTFLFKIKPASAKQIVFVEVSVVQVPDQLGRSTYYNVEKLLPDYKNNYTKWSNNAGNRSSDTFL
jgi:hypothetical protein